MRRSSKIALWGAWGTFGCLILLVVLYLLLPYVVNIPFIKAKIRSYAGQSIQGQVNYAKIEIHLLPTPHITILDSQLSISDQLAATVAGIAVYPRPLPLLIGKIHIDAVTIESPTVNLQMPSPEPTADQQRDQTPAVSFDNQAAAALAAVAQKLTDGRLQVTNGILTLLRDTRPILRMTDLELLLSKKNEEIRMDGSARSDFTAEVGVQMTMAFPAPVADNRPPAFQVAIQGHDIDLTAVRHITLALTDKATPVFDIVQGGRLSEVSLTSTGASVSALVERLRITGRATEGLIAIPVLNLDLTEVSGAVAFAEGTLTVEQASARFGKTTGRNGRFSIGFNRNPNPIMLEIDLDADLSRYRLYCRR